MAGPHAQLLPRREMQIWRQVGEIDHAQAKGHLNLVTFAAARKCGGSSGNARAAS
jgi:hypothetical protein